MDFEAVISTVVNWATTTGVKIIVALLILFVSFKIINGLTKRLDKALSNKKRPLDKTLRTTFIYLIKLVGKCLVAVALIGYLGIDTSGITALIASLGVCVGLAVNGALSNLAGGVMLLVTRPFKVDDFIEAQGYSGTVEDIHIVSTRIRTADNKVVYIPNGSLSSGTIVNYSEKGTRRLDLTFSIAYENDFERAKEIVLELAASHELVMKDPAPFVRLSSHAQSSLDIVCRVWTQTADYWTVNFDLLESVKLAFDKAGISIPYNQLDVHVKND
ncbi:MAG: mechanosensitive ion channel [Clostridia bacterium]|nr:mechanosensitive ion channel [Clostridia bacterium]